ncbi:MULTISPECIES: TIGR03084 family metal-binding protein [Nocardioides]|uniref:TIGR03084 family metal-binding protein n=1 Tax=Nocardioides vastitatis TaxID=2568655 RepID=A0ABW0ZDZ4_9ACTN|nr:TIGR03084 family metal-binding protein [Nocardioides sp.]THJ02724.1 TIGR03084 family protein [Nocardioides sp.]
MSLLDAVLADLTAEGDRLRSVVVELDDSAAGSWATPTPAEGWTVATQVAHLLWTDEVAVLAAAARSDAGRSAWDEVVLKAIENPAGFVDEGALDLAELRSEELLARWDAGRAALAEALRSYPDGLKLPWFGPPMSPTSMATARFMETWAHALDVYDALGVRPEVTDRIRHVAHLGVRTRDFSFANNQLEAPAEEFRVELTAPGGELWTWGAEDATQSVMGSAYDFCRLVTQRIHRDDTDLAAVGQDAERWLTIAQAFAGPAGGGRVPRLAGARTSTTDEETP